MPGWISRHKAMLADDGGSIQIERGNVCSRDKGKKWVENIDDWRLRLDVWSWEHSGTEV